MKAIIVIAALAISGSCFADVYDDILATARRAGEDRRTMFASSDQFAADYSRSASVTYRPDPSVYQAPKVDYTIVTLPSGKTATALTFK